MQRDEIIWQIQTQPHARQAGRRAGRQTNWNSKKKNTQAKEMRPTWIYIHILNAWFKWRRQKWISRERMCVCVYWRHICEIYGDCSVLTLVNSFEFVFYFFLHWNQSVLLQVSDSLLMWLGIELNYYCKIKKKRKKNRKRIQMYIQKSGTIAI